MYSYKGNFPQVAAVIDKPKTNFGALKSAASGLSLVFSGDLGVSYIGRVASRKPSVYSLRYGRKPISPAFHAVAAGRG
jgi:hypothetical protein